MTSPLSERLEAITQRLKYREHARARGASSQIGAAERDVQAHAPADLAFLLGEVKRLRALSEWPQRAPLIPPPLPAPRESKRMSDRLFRHYKGGLYRFIAEATHTETGEQVVVYEHLWPNPHGVYVRPAEMFFGNADNGAKRFIELIEKP